MARVSEQNNRPAALGSPPCHSFVCSFKSFNQVKPHCVLTSEIWEDVGCS
jgi:hypothetical protein